jgi:large subunit ribosomal protein L29
MAKANVIDLAEIRAKAVEELQGLLVGKRDEARAMRFKHAMGQLQKTHQLRQLRRDIARIETVLHTRRQAQQGV